MLIGEYRHNLDDKKRLAIPSKFRKEVGKRVVVTHGLDNCLTVYPEKQWAVVAENLANLSVGKSDTRGFSRYMLASAVEVDVDSAGRILIPDYLKAFAGLLENVVVTGAFSRLELWEPARWDTYKKGVTEKADALAEKLGEIGAL